MVLADLAADWDWVAGYCGDHTVRNYLWQSQIKAETVLRVAVLLLLCGLECDIALQVWILGGQWGLPAGSWDLFKVIGLLDVDFVMLKDAGGNQGSNWL